MRNLHPAGRTSRSTKLKIAKKNLRIEKKNIFFLNTRGTARSTLPMHLEHFASQTELFFNSNLFFPDHTIWSLFFGPGMFFFDLAFFSLCIILSSFLGPETCCSEHLIFF